MSKMGQYYFEMQDAHYNGECLARCEICKDEQYENKGYLANEQHETL